MTDWTRSPAGEPIGATIYTGHPATAAAYSKLNIAGTHAAAVAPAATRAIFIPFLVPGPVTAQQMFWENGAVAGTTDVGIYDITATRLVSTGPITNAGTIQIVNITATLLQPGAYYMAWLPSTNTTQTYLSLAVSVVFMRANGMQQQAVGSATLPNPATFAAVASAYIPLVGVNFRASM